MNLNHPSALFWAALAIPVVIFYILKVRLRRVPVSTILFWEQIFEEKRPRSLWQRLRHLISLLIQLAFLLLLIFALTEPFFSWEAQQARRVVLVVDNSASMNATDVVPTRLARAKQEGIAIIDGLRFFDEVAILSAGSQPRVHCGLTGHQRTLRQALESIPSTEGPTSVKEAVGLARRLLVDQKKQQVIVLTDVGFDGAMELAKAKDVEVVGFGTRVGNVGITRLQARRSLIDPIGYQILVEVVNASEHAVECRLEIDLGDEVVDVVPLSLAANGRWSQTFEKTSADGGRLRVKLDRRDALMVDNEAVAYLPKRELKPVELITSGNLFLEKVLEANPLVRLAVSQELPRTSQQGAITVLHRKTPERIPPGSVLVVEPTGSCDLWQLGETLQNPIVTKQDKDSPLMANVRLDNVLMPEARKITPKKPVKLLATSIEGDPLLCTFERPEGKVLVLSVNLDKGDLPLQTAFPILAANALGWFAGTKGELLESLPTGSITAMELPQGSVAAAGGGLSLRGPTGTIQPLAMDGEKALVGPLDRCGVWTLLRRVSKPNGQEESRKLLEVGCNLANRRESDIRLPEGIRGRASLASVGLGGWPVWFVLIVLAWVLTCVEWVFYQRRWIS